MALLFRFVIFILLLSGITVNSQNATCADDRWGPDCQNVCGECFIQEASSTGNIRECDVTTGECQHGCAGEYVQPMCADAICTQGCGAGICIAPGICANCGDINKVAPNCEDIRLRGLIGSAISFVVIISSVTLCGLGSVWYKRHSNAAVSL